MNLTLERAGFLTTVQDLGRTNHRASGVSLCGALDSHALRVANLLAGNSENAAGLEIVSGNLLMRSSASCLLAWCGGDFEVRIAETKIPAGRVARLDAGEPLRISANAGRAWLAISGGIDVPLVLGSRSTDLRSGFGGQNGRALRDGETLAIGQSRVRFSFSSRFSHWSAPNEWSSPRQMPAFLHVIKGAEASEFSIDEFTRQTFIVTQDSNRMGLRLQGSALIRASEAELVSEAVAPGTIQVPPDGQPILLLGDCQTIGGYPKIAHVITVDLSRAAQLQGGDEVRFVEVSLADARELLAERARDLQFFRAALELRR